MPSLPCGQSLVSACGSFFFFSCNIWDLIPCCCCCSVAQLCPSLCDPVDFSVLHYLPGVSSNSVHWVNDAIQPSHPLLPPSSISVIRVVSSAYLIFLLAILIPACASSSPAFCMMNFTCKLNKQSDNIQPWCTPFQRRQRQPTPVFLPGKSHGRGSLVGCRPWGR